MRLKSLLVFSSAIFLLAGCKKNFKEPSSNSPGTNGNLMTMSSPADSFFVDLPMARAFAERLSDSIFLGGLKDSTVHLLDTIFPVPDSSGNAALYVFNYANNGGYIVMSADLRYEPICAYVREGHLHKSDKIPSQLGAWFAKSVEDITYIRSQKNIGGSDGIAGVIRWSTLSGSIYLEHMPNPNIVNFAKREGCFDPNLPSVNIASPLLSTQWGQGCYYNDAIAFSSCPQTCNGRMWTGCVATAMAQVIRYWEHQPSAYLPYNFSTMPIFATNLTTNGDMAQLLKDCGTSVSMNYGCDKSGADGGFFNWLFGNTVVPNALQNHFDYLGATEETYDYGDRWTIKADIDADQPVLLSGYTDQSSFLWWEWGDESGHEWVCDGYRHESNACGSRFWFHMNWGWNGLYNDYYYQSNWGNPQGSYQYQQEIIHGIHPN